MNDPIKDWEEIPQKDRDQLKLLDPDLHDKLLTKYQAERGRRDFWYFSTVILKNPVLYEPFHRPIAEWAQDWSKHDAKLLLLARGHVKSNQYTVEYPLWRATKDPEIRILLGSHKNPDAAKFLFGIKQYIDRHENFRKHYPEIIPMPGSRGRPVKWSADKALLNRESGFLECTFETTSPGSEVTGRHYDFMCLDDLVTHENKDRPREVREFHELCESLLVGNAQRFVIGTRYAFDDEYGRIIDTPDIADTYDILVQPALKDISILDEFMSGRKRWKAEHDEQYLVYPTHFTLRSANYDPGFGAPIRKSLLAIRKRQGATTFANQYLLEPFDPSDAVFVEEDIKIVDAVPDDPELTYYQSCDLSSEKHTGDSYTAIVKSAVDSRGNIFIIDIFWGDKDPAQTVEYLIDSQCVSPAIRPRWVSMEPGPYERSIRPWLDRRSRERKVNVPVWEISYSQHQHRKDEHIKGLQPWVQNGKFHILQSCAHRDLLVEEMVKFPALSRKDILDATAQVPMIALPGNWKDYMDQPGVEAVEVEPVNRHIQEGTVAQGETFNDVLASIQARNSKKIGHHQVMKAGVVRMARR